MLREMGLSNTLIYFGHGNLGGPLNALAKRRVVTMG